MKKAKSDKDSLSFMEHICKKARQLSLSALLQNIKIPRLFEFFKLQAYLLW